MFIGDNQTLDMLLDIATRIFEFYLHALFTGSLLVDFCISALVDCINGEKLPFNLLPGFKKYTIDITFEKYRKNSSDEKFETHQSQI